MTASSCVIASTSGRSARSSSLNSSGISLRPVRSHSSRGWSTGISISRAPIASISSRSICSTRRWTLQPAGRKVHIPAPELAHEPRAHHQDVGQRLRVRGRFLQHRQEIAGEAGHRERRCYRGPSPAGIGVPSGRRSIPLLPRASLPAPPGPSATFRALACSDVCVAPPSLDNKPGPAVPGARRARARERPRRPPLRRRPPGRSTRMASPAGSCWTVSGTAAATPPTGAGRAAGSARGRCAGGAPRRCRMPPTRATSRARSYTGGVWWYRKDFQAPGGRGDRLGAALRVGQLPGDRVAERAPRGQPQRRIPPLRGARPRPASHRREPARGAGGQPPRRDGGPPDRPPQGRPVHRRLVELRRHPARGLSAPGRHARPRQRARLPAPVVPDLPGQDLRARGGREPPGHPGGRGAHRHGRRPHDRVPARDDLGPRLPSVPRQRDDREPPALEPVGPASLHREAGRRARRRRRAAVHAAHRRPDPGGGRSGPDAAERQAPGPARRQHARGGPDARRGARRRRRSPRTSTCCATWARR